MNRSILTNLEAEGTQEPQNPTPTPVTTRERVTTRDWGTKGPLLFHAEQDRMRHREKRKAIKSYHEAYKKRKARCDNEKWRFATLNVNGTTNDSRIHHLKHELRAKRIDVAFLQETLYQDSVDLIHDYTIINSGSLNVARKKKWGTSIAVHEALTPHIQEVERKKGILTRVKIGKLAIAPWGPKTACHFISIYIPLIPAEAEEAWNELYHQISKIPSEDVYIIGGDYNAHMSAGHSEIAARNGQPKPTGPIGPFFIPDGEDNYNGENMKRFMRTNGLFSPLTRFLPKMGRKSAQRALPRMQSIEIES